LLDPSVLTLGFARRFATYKRADLLFNDFERLKMLLNDRWRSVQIYYDVSEEGVPFEWVKIMKESIKSNAARFSARRMVKEYAEKFYKKALKNL